MGCTSSKPPALGNQQKSNNRKYQVKSKDHAKKVVSDRDLEKQLSELLDKERKNLSMLAKPMMERRMSYDNLLDSMEAEQNIEAHDQGSSPQAESDIEDSDQVHYYGVEGISATDIALIKRDKQNRRKKAKLLAEAEQKWMIFHDLDMYDEAEIVSLARFMDTVIHKVPKISQTNTQKQSFLELNKLNAEDGIIAISRENSKNNSLSSINTMNILNNLNIAPSSQTSAPSSSISVEKRNSFTSNSNINNNNSVSDGIQADRRDSKGNVLITLSRENSVENFLRLENISFPRMPSSKSIGSDLTAIRSVSSENLLSSASTSSTSPSLVSTTQSVNKEQNNNNNNSQTLNTLEQNTHFETNESNERNDVDLQGHGASSRKSDGFDLPSGLINLSIATQIMDLYKSGERLSTKSVHKILRLAYRSLKKFSNTTRVTLSANEQVTVVGDLHGQLPDLLHILDDAGLPSPTHKFIFNGDFVDRGAYGVEVVCLLLALHIAMPTQVVLNRGNHEDFAICCAYGFQKECLTKYDELTFGMFIEVFNHIPLFATINDSVFVVHGGLFHATDTTISELNHINRYEFSLRDLPEEGEALRPIPRSDHSDFLKQLQRDALWSDPRDLPGLDFSPRGAGVSFGPDIARAFLKANNLQMIVRSHECVRSGFERPFQGEDDEDILATIFSASNYSGGGNTAAYMNFSLDSSSFARNTISSLLHKVPSSPIIYSVHYFHIDPDEYGFEAPNASDDTMSTDSGDTIPFLGGDSFSLKDLIVRKKQVLLDSFYTADIHKAGLISKDTWADVMHHTLRVHIKWAALLPVLVRDDCFRNDNEGNQMIDYVKFLNSISVTLQVTQKIRNGLDNDDEEHQVDDLNEIDIDGSLDNLTLSGSIIEALYSHHKQLEIVFKFFDSDDDGVITKEEFLKGCEILNENLPLEDQIQDPERVLDLMDVKENGEIDINLFFEMFRMSDIHGNINIGTENNNSNNNNISNSNLANVIKMDASNSASSKKDHPLLAHGNSFKMERTTSFKLERTSSLKLSSTGNNNNPVADSGLSIDTSNSTSSVPIVFSPTKDSMDIHGITIAVDGLANTVDSAGVQTSSVAIDI